MKQLLLILLLSTTIVKSAEVNLLENPYLIIRRDINLTNKYKIYFNIAPSNLYTLQIATNATKPLKWRDTGYPFVGYQWMATNFYIIVTNNGGVNPVYFRIKKQRYSDT